MMQLDEATRAQIAAADPAASTWLMANAGSGKTRVLTDRVAWLLLKGARPERILCLTFTKAAASEMQNRLFDRLGQWAMLEDAALDRELAQMGVPETDRGPDRLARARTLFASAIEAPGGLRIQTIHAFAASILRRFPLEAKVSPAFQEIEERVQLVLLDEVLDRIAEGPDADAVAGVAAYASGSDLRDLMTKVLDHRDAFEDDRPDARTALGIDAGLTDERVLAAVLRGGERALCQRVALHLDFDNKQQGAVRRRLQAVSWERPRLEDLALLEGALLTSAKAAEPFAPKIGTFASAEVRDALGPDLALLEALMERVAHARTQRVALLAAERAEALDRFARVLIPSYDAAKAARGWLDFSDLIRRARALLVDPELAPWVLFRLDGGIDHLLVDEAQDTSLAQWDVVTALTEEFAAGHGARSDLTRTLFVVGDVKQSIYSFQGADPVAFDRMRHHFDTRLSTGPAPLQTRNLIYSFRSAPLILRLVDEVARGPAAAGIGADVEHAAFHGEMPGRIDIWPVIEKAEDTPAPDWFDPVDMPQKSSPDVQMAVRVADFVADTLKNPPELQGGKPVSAGDILILVRRRSRLFTHLIRELKARDLPLLGADRFPVTEQLAVKDLMALMKVLATPADDLSLAAILRSPLFGFSDDALYRVAHGRQGKLWSNLDGEAAEILADLRRRAGTLRPYELLERALTAHGFRMRIISRLGAEAEDAIDALLAQALSYERSEIPTLTGFIAWLEADELKIRRDAGQSTGMIRVMTVHGAKGLEAPVVILPDTGKFTPRSSGNTLLADDDGPVFWAPRKDDMAEELAGLAATKGAANAAENDRLLYVAMTRAAQWLIVGAAGAVDSSGAAEGASWYSKIRAAMTRMDGVETALPGGAGLRLQTGDWSVLSAPEPEQPEPVKLPAWATKRAPQETAARALSPSDLGGAKALPGDPGARDEAAALRHGRLIHLLLEHLPPLPQSSWAAAAPGILAIDGPSVPQGAELEALLSEAVAVLSAPKLRPLFSPQALAEVTLTAHSPTLDRQLLGQIDRLIVEPGRVLAVDFKTNMQLPVKPADVPEGLLRQMGAYAEMLAPIYPNDRIDTAILWTRGPVLMALPHDAVRAALARARAP
ncbi:MAG: double-strand break repair helicase AddA [Pseudomonadota bacterium]